jgi:DNA-directed RNA polymerase subunit RPC12/RpoP
MTTTEQEARRLGKFWVYVCQSCGIEILRRYQDHEDKHKYCTDCKHEIRMQRQRSQKAKDVKEAFDL